MFSIMNSAILLEPPKPITKSEYICDKRFHLDSLLTMFEDDDVYGVVFITGKMYSIYKIYKSYNHLSYKKISENKVDLPRKHNKGGQSSVRFGRLHDEKELAYIKKVSEIVIRVFADIKQLIIAGPSEKKNLLRNSDLIIKYFDKIVSTVITPKITTNNINEILCKISNNLDNDDDKIIKRIEELLFLADDKLVFSIEEIQELLNCNSLNELILCREIEHLIEIPKDTKCRVTKIDQIKIKKIGLDIVGVKFY